MYLACKPKIFAIWIFKKKFSNSDINVVCFLVFFFFWGGVLVSHIYSIWKFPSQGLNLIHSCDLCCSVATPYHLIHCAGSGIEPAPQW